MSDHKVDSMKGKLKETIGDVTGDKGLQIEGKLEQSVAAAKGKFDEAKDKAATVIHREPSEPQPKP